jgi:hypothetical protein
MEWRQSILDGYEVSETGDLRRLFACTRFAAGHVLNGSLDTHGYRTYRIRGGGKSTSYRAHTLVLLAFVGPKPTPDHQCAHWDGNRLNNHWTNLRWATAAENTADKIRHGTVYNGHRKFLAEEVMDMAAMRKDGARYVDIQERYKISKGNLSAILNGATWSHVTGIEAGKKKPAG